MNRLIVTCDDCGLSEGVNSAALDLHRRGMTGSASVLTNFPASVHALELFRAFPAFGVGVHLNLTDGYPLTAIPAAAGLTGPDGRFRPMANLVRRSLFPSARTLSLIGGELTAQFEVLVRGGFAVEHVTTHLQFHVVPSLRRIVLRLAHTYNVAWVRTHRVRATVVPWNPLLSRSLGSPASSSGLPLGPTTLPSSGRPSGPSAPRSADQPLGPAAPQSEDQPHRPAAPQPADLPLDPLASTVSARPLNPAAPATRGVTAPDYMAVLRNWQGREPEALVRTLAGLRGTVELVVHPGIADDPTFPSYITYGPQDRFAETRFLARCWPLLRQITASRSRLP